MATTTQGRDSLGTNTLTVALIGPDDLRRNAVADALTGSQARVARTFTSYPDIDDVPRLLESDYDVVIIELDSDREHALDLIENICAGSSVTVMAYSSQADPSMLVRCMRAGAREFLSLPISPGAMEEALVRAMVRRPAGHPVQKAIGKLQVFIGAKGGCGVTTIASNFALVVAQESNQNTVLIDLGLPIGDAVLGLGIRSQFSVANALENFNRLDSNFFSKLLAKHSSGLSVLAAPDGYTPVKTTVEGIERLVTVARRTFDYVIVDAGSQMGPASNALFKEAAAVYLVTEVSISGLRNANRLITEFFTASGFKPEIVLNRFTQRTLGIDEKDIAKALTMAPQWKIPSDYRAVSRAQNTAHPLVLEDSPISRVIRQMARAACGLQKNPEKKKGFSLFG
ncbi:MAG: CpaE family protein [Acidobacteriaceae bacterium]